MSGNDSFALFSSVKVVRELLRRRLEHGAGPARDELEAGLQEIETLWEELRQQSHVLASERQRYSEFFEHAPDAYFITDSYGVIREANRAACDLLHMPGSVLRGRPLISYVAEAERRDFRSHLLHASAQPDGEISAWRCMLAPHNRAPVGVLLRVRAMPAPDAGLAALCWLVRRVE